MTQVHFLPLSDIIVPSDEERTRPLSPQAALDLYGSIKSVGLLSPIIAHVSNGTYTLIAGKHRWTAFAHHESLLEKEPLTFLGTEIPPGHIPTLFLHENPDLLLEMEIAENVYRFELPWRDRVALLARIAKKTQEEAPGTTLTAVAEKLARSTGANANTVRKRMAQAVILADHLDDPDVKKAETVQGAMNVLEGKMRRQLTSFAQAAPVPEEIQSIHTFHQGDCREVMKDLPDATFDLILSDPPYGVNASEWEQGVHEHEYVDDLKTSMSIYYCICAEGFRLTKDEANMFLFCDIKHFHRIFRFATECGWVAWPTPIIWQKSTEGMAPWGRKGFTKVYEVLLFATKGKKGLHTACLDVLSFSRPSKGERVHAAQKPVELLSHLISISSKAGDRILDPCCGSGSIFRAGWDARCPVTGIELDPAFIPSISAAMEKKPAVVPITIAAEPKTISVEDLL